MQASKRKRAVREKGDESLEDLRAYARRMKRRRVTDRAFGPNRIFRFCRSDHEVATIIMNAVATSSSGAFEFKLNSLPGFTEFTSLFDKYRIVKVKALWMPRITQQTVAGALTAATSTSPPIVTVIDQDDSTPGDFTVLQQYDNAKWHPGYEPFTVMIYPRVAQAIFGGSVFTSYGNASAKQWVDVASPDVPYYSLKWATAPYSASLNGNQSWDISFKYYLEFMNPR